MAIEVKKRRINWISMSRDQSSDQDQVVDKEVALLL